MASDLERFINAQDVDGNEQLVSMHQAAEIFEPKTEYVYKFLQVRRRALMIGACVWRGGPILDPSQPTTPRPALPHCPAQMFSACCVSFAHGAKDSANAGE